MTKIILNAPAKINLYLHITGKKPNGYHLLDSLVVFSDIGDVITIEASSQFSLTCDGPFAQNLPKNPDDNLIYKTVKVMADHINQPPNVAINLTKNLPIAAGIGGGSSDAATVLKGLAKIWGITDINVLHNIGLSLGADIPACLFKQPCFMRGIGGEIIPADNIPSMSLILINPNVPLSTPDVFQNRSAPFSKMATFNSAHFIDALSKTTNDLQHSACQLAPEVQQVLDSLNKQKGCVFSRMSGSGATCFALFNTSKDATGAVLKLKSQHPNWWIECGKTYSSPPA